MIARTWHGRVMTEKADAGDMIDQEPVPIETEQTETDSATLF